MRMRDQQARSDHTRRMRPTHTRSLHDHVPTGAWYALSPVNVMMSSVCVLNPAAQSLSFGAAGQESCASSVQRPNTSFVLKVVAGALVNSFAMLNNVCAFARPESHDAVTGFEELALTKKMRDTASFKLDVSISRHVLPVPQSISEEQDFS
jgi:hypothetical protein